MARIARVVAPGYPHHITQRGNRRQQTFFTDEYRWSSARAHLTGKDDGLVKAASSLKLVDNWRDLLSMSSHLWRKLTVCTAMRGQGGPWAPTVL